ncbi:bifunctional UDP-N-acetylglucosamine diphosphorylase/glucosamine-1-phosphate N-acetyltransferase GlmU [Larsenimonas suaedae]|uniref:Bifunctional protein GlmU n=1 Tax=Larsenimonas suaedae TaxID=1851019 RepID=A0ABU1GVK7_9GAMM|nr:bifunctional UDP-N-acetylglucosamine diphosphorylase/glucosamine-1-phosphate N-acetyltransferase GlmU [Larsenimonas suaedae]MCM2973182.1 bifunctional UDP-N-acetylglucosamine diphosphorylase/glucosamine-1-phosphate N-acetyltransferase GlmU [Larsenimonas suaedae]MDR5896075.1 bifunctional UDP-N-acetylglucosamine diphosphorylase/glucosamine-1-phosphate N-acetyltransferase GlmU [Larsenimonas suaedae]
MTTDVVILAAGQGSRMKSTLPKVLHPLAGKPMVQHVVDAAKSIGEATLHVVVGHGAERVEKTLSDQNIRFALQKEQKGTGHAVAQTLENLGDGPVLVLYGDVPLIKSETLAALLEKVDDDHLGLLTVTVDDPSGYGRIVRENGAVTSIVEQKDATDAQKAIQECNTGILATTGKKLKQWLPALSSNNAQGEYYLTDIIAMAAGEGVAITTAEPMNEHEVQGVNDRVQLAHLERIHQKAQAETLMRSGASLADPNRIDVRGRLSVGQDVFIDVGCVFEGDVVLEDGVHVGPYTLIKNSVIKQHTVIAAHSIVESAQVGEEATIGPFARLRPGTELADQAKVGNFVETKNAKVGKGSKINHLSYIGDAELGSDVNVGAGTITCNYDGVNKHKTLIGNGAFIGSNTALVAPVDVGHGATIAAGSTITDRVSEDALAIARGRQVEKNDWVRPAKK